MRTQRTIRSYFIPIVVLCSVFGGVIGAVGPVSGDTDRLQAGEINERVHTSDSGIVSHTASIDGVAIDTVTTQTAPRSSFGEVETGGEISGRATESQTIATGDVLVLEVASVGLSNALASDSESDTDSNARLLELVQAGALDVRITNGASNTTVDLSATNEEGGLRVLPGTDGSNVYILLDTERAVFERDRMGVETGALDVVIDSPESKESVSERVTVTPRTASFQTEGSGTINLPADTNRTITGNTTVAPGTELTVHIRSKEEAVFNITRSTRVKEDGTFDLRVDFGNMTKGTPFELSISNEGFAADTVTDGVLTAASTASVRLTPQYLETGSQQRVVVDSANLSEGGFLVAYDRSFLTRDQSEDHESYRGVSEYLQPGSHTNVNITLDSTYEGEGTVVVIPHLDTNDNGEFDRHNASIDEPYRGADGGAIIAVQNVSTDSDAGDTLSTADYTGSSDVSADSGTSTNNIDGGHADSAANGTDERGNEKDAESTDVGGQTDARLSEADGPGFGPLSGVVAVGIITVLVVVARSRQH